MSSLRAGLLAATLLAVGMLSACGGGYKNATNDPTPPVPPVITVSVSPTTTSVDQGDTSQFSVSVTGSSNQAVIWSIQEGSAGGSINQAGLYTAPAAAMDVHVVATSVADTSKSSSALVTVNAVSVSMPATAGVPRGRQRQFTADHPNQL